MAQDRDETAEKGTGGARTLRENPGAAADRAAPGGDLAASVKQLAAELRDAGGDQLDLIEGSPDVLDLDTLATAANQVAAQRRARGRPAGSGNKRNAAIFDYLAALGHRHPAVTLSLIQTADTMALARALGTPMTDDEGHVLAQPLVQDGKLVMDGKGEPVMVPIIQPADPVKILAIQQKAAGELLPFDLAKKKELEVKRTDLHLFVAGSLDAGGAAAEAARGLSIFGSKVLENQPLTEATSVRLEEGQSHETENASDISNLDGKGS